MDYLNMNIGSRGRMNVLRRSADRLNSNPNNARRYRGDNTPYSWRDVRYGGFNSAAGYHGYLTKGKDGNAVIWYARSGQQFPREKYADECDSGIRHRGWFSDGMGFGVVRGLVVALPHGRFLAGYHESETEERVYFPEVYESERDAALAADRCAERVAADLRREDMRFREAEKLQETEKEKIQRLRECLALRNNPCFSLLRSEAKLITDQLRDIRETLKTEYSDVI